MSRFTRTILALLALVTSGCESCNDCSADQADDESASRAEPTLLEDEQGGAGHGDAGAPRPEQPAEPFGVQMERAMQRIEAAVEAGIAAERGDTQCERALHGMNAMIGHLASTAEPGTPVPPAPNDHAFIQLCESLDLDLQRCMTLSYSQENQAECERLAEELPPDVKQRLEAVVAGQ